MEYVWYTDATGFGLWKRFESEGEEVERPIYNQQQQAKWFTEEVRSDSDVEELSQDFLDCLALLRNEIDVSSEGRTDEAETVARYRKDLHQDLDYKGKKVVSEILMYYGKSDLQALPEMQELLDYAAEKSNLDFSDLDRAQGDGE
jgi:hypothetical protein